MTNRPQTDEYNPYYSTYIDLVGNEPILDILTDLRDSTYAFFTSLSNEEASHSYAEGKWTVKQVIGHMSDAERVFAYRALTFSREAIELPSFNQDVYIEGTTFNSRTLADLAGEFKTIRQSTLYLIRSLTEKQLTQKGIASGNPVSVRALAYMIAGHELHHLRILRERYL